MSAAQLIGLDVGTTSCKAGLFSADGTLLALASASYPLERPRAGWVEQDASHYWEAAIACLRDLVASPAYDARTLAAISSCGQVPTLILLNESGEPVRPAIVWQDTRAAGEAEELARSPGPDALTALLGMRWPVDASMPLARLRWLQRHEPDALKHTAVICVPKDLVHFRLTGRASTDAWSARGLVNQGTRRPVDGLLDLCGISPECVPPALRSQSPAGTVDRQGASASGLPEGLPVIAGWSDAMAAMLGSGAMGEPGLACDVSGTSEVIGLTVSAPPADTRGLVSAPILESGLWMLYGPTQASGASLGWAMRALGAETLSIDAALAEAGTAPAGSNGALFLPYIDGERAPLWDSRVRGAFLGLSSQHARPHLLRAVLEGVAFSVRHILSLAENCAGETAREVRIAGGGARLGLWNDIKAGVTQRPFRPCRTSENGVLGAAMIAALGAGLYDSVAEASRQMVQFEAPVVPDSAMTQTYTVAFRRYVSVYPALRNVLVE